MVSNSALRQRQESEQLPREQMQRAYTYELLPPLAQSACLCGKPAWGGGGGLLVCLFVWGVFLLCFVFAVSTNKIP